MKNTRQRNQRALEMAPVSARTREILKKMKQDTGVPIYRLLDRAVEETYGVEARV